MYTYQGKDKPFFDGWEWMCGVCRRHGWEQARDTFNVRFPHDMKNYTPEQWQYAKGACAYLQETM